MSTATPEMVASTVAAASATGMTASSVFITLLIPALILWAVYFRLSRRHLIELGEKLPGPAGWPLVGNALELIGSSDGKQFFLCLLKLK